MPRRRLTRTELIEQFAVQWRHLENSCHLYDSGEETEAIRLAVTIRVLLHDTRHSQSLLGQLGRLDTLFFDTAEDVNPENLLPTFGLVLAKVGPQGASYVPPLGMLLPRGTWLIPFDPWWNKPVVTIPNRLRASRRDLVLWLANQDGGAHVSPDMDETYYQLTRENSIGAVTIGYVQNGPVLGIATASVRQIAQEVMVSLVRPMTVIPPDLAEEHGIPRRVVMTDARTGVTTDRTITPPVLCMCRSGLPYPQCHARGGINEGRVTQPKPFDEPLLIPIE